MVEVVVVVVVEVEVEEIMRSCCSVENREKNDNSVHMLILM